MINAEEMGITSDNINKLTYNKTTPASPFYWQRTFEKELNLQMTGPIKLSDKLVIMKKATNAMLVLIHR